MIFQSSFFGWGVALVVLIPLLIILLNEVIDRLRRRESLYAEIFVLVRDVMLPLMATLIVLRLVFIVEETDIATRLISTLFWSILVLVVFRFMRAIIGTGEYEEDDWRSSIPHMFLRLPAYALIGYVVFHVIQNVWALPLQEMATTLGIGSVVIAFALQDTLSNLVSGLLLVANSPFKTGEWIKVGDAEGKVVAVDWRYTSIETRHNNLIVIPNGAISGESIENFSRPTGHTMVAQSIVVNFAHPPNLVREAMTQAMLETPGICNDPAPRVVINNHSDPELEYMVKFWIDNYGDKPDIHNDFMTRVWYVFERYGIALPTTTFEVQTYDGFVVNEHRQVTTETRISYLKQLSAFSSLSQDIMQMLGEKSSHQRYGVSEQILNIGSEEAGLYIVHSGLVHLSMYDEEGNEHLIDTLRTGGIFGETGLVNRPISPVMVKVKEDAEVLVIPHEVMSGIINKHGQFAEDINSLINQRRKAEDRIINMALAMSHTDIAPYLQPANGQNGQLSIEDSTDEDFTDEDPTDVGGNNGVS